MSKDGCHWKRLNFEYLSLLREKTSVVMTTRSLSLLIPPPSLFSQQEIVVRFLPGHHDLLSLFLLTSLTNINNGSQHI